MSFRRFRRTTLQKPELFTSSTPESDWQPRCRGFRLSRSLPSQKLELSTLQAGSHFVPYLPQDNRDSPEAEDLISLLSTELDRLLKSPPAEFWKAVKSTPSLAEFIGTYLQFCRRPYDGDSSTTPSLTRQQLSRDVFLLLFRLVYDESSSGGVPQRDQGILLHDKQLLDVPRLLDIAALYAWSNPELTKELLTKAFKLEPRWASELEAAANLIGSNLSDIHATCKSAVQELQTAHSPARLQGLSDGLSYLTDACQTLAAFVKVYPNAAQLILRRSQLHALLPAIHDELLPAAVTAFSKVEAAAAPGGPKARIQAAAAAAADLHAAFLLWGCLQNPEGAPQRSPSAAAQCGKDVLSLLLPGGRPTGLTMLTQRRHGLSSRLAFALHQGSIQLDKLQCDRLFDSLGDPAALQSSQADSAKAEKREQLAKIHEVLPGYGDGFLTACLHAAGGDSARVITQLLEGSLPEELRKLDPQLKLTESKPGPSGSSADLPLRDPTASTPAAAAPSSQRNANVHKGTAYALRSTAQDVALAKLHAAAAQWEEYEDEYDDSFDDLANYDADVSATTRGEDPEAGPGPAPSRPHTLPRGGKPLWVLNGRVYNYRKEGATPVPNQAAADEEVRAQKAAAVAIHGLGAGGNKPASQGPSEAGGQAAPGRGSGGGGGEGPSDSGRGGRGRGRGRGAPPSDTRRAHLFKTEHKAALGNHHRKDRALRKMGGPAS